MPNFGGQAALRFGRGVYAGVRGSSCRKWGLLAKSSIALKLFDAQ